MTTSKLPVRLMISLDWPVVDASLVLSRERMARARALAAMDVLKLVRIPATVGIPDPETPPEAIQWQAAGHDVALLADATWAAPSAPRSLLAAELATRVARARAKGLAVTTLAIPHSELTPHTDLLAKHGIQAVRKISAVKRRSGFSGMFHRSPPLAPRLVRYGLYEMPAVLEISDVRGLTQLGRLLGEARPGEVVHAVIRPAELLAARNALARLEQLVRSVQAGMASGLMVVESCRQCATRLMMRRQAVPARSILRLAG